LPNIVALHWLTLWCFLFQPGEGVCGLEEEGERGSGGAQGTWKCILYSLLLKVVCSCIYNFIMRSGKAKA